MRCLFLSLELPSILQIVALGQLNVGSDRRTNVVNNATQVAVRHIGLDDDPPLDVLAIQGVGTKVFGDLSDLRQRNLGTDRGVDGGVAERFDRRLGILMETNQNVVGAMFVENGRRDMATIGGIHPFRDVFGRQSHRRGCLAVHSNLDLRNTDLRLHQKVDHSLDTLHLGLDLFGLGPKHVEIGTEEFDGDLGSGSAEHMVDAVADRLAHFYVHPGDATEASSDVLHKLGMRPVRGSRHYLDFARVHPGRVLVEFGATGPPRRGNNLGDLMQLSFKKISHPIGLLKGGARRQVGVDIQRPFVERRKKLTSHKREQRQR